MKKAKVSFGISLLAAAMLFTSQPASLRAQSDDSMTRAKNRGALYYLGEQDELLIKVNIWGFVENPGQYMVPKSTDLISLVSFAGGPREEAKLKNVKIIRNQALLASRSSRNEDYLAMNGKSGVALNVKQNDVSTEQGKKVIRIDVKKYLSTGDENLIPELRPGDTIIVEGSTFHFISRVFDFTTKLAVIAQAYFLFKAARN